MQPDVMAKRCASRAYMALLADKWSLLVINALGEGPMRNGALMRRIEGISQKMLTQTLRSLETLHIVARRDLQTIPPNVTYELTALGQSLRREAVALIRWVEAHVPDLAPR
ncbi:winged helix-turn-helix transcriptional regulator [Erythrobacter sp. NE805]|uniref:winged helix-turn-helix transcriptional regulator n=1 Tax=Erythrobacter sp. NE805 TaxID=3389875 RepID=UPI00396AF61D